MTYKETLEWMFRQLPMYQRQGKTAFKKDLTNSLAFSKHLNHPERKYKTIHVAGTNGKGSTSHLLASVLQESGLKVGLYTSPHLKDFRERIKVDGKEILKEEVVEFIEENSTFLKEHRLSFFEMTVGMAFDHFYKRGVDIAVVEVGLGGRLDSTNIISPEISVITNIGYDHTQFLGETLEEIAHEKAGIIKAGIPVVIGEYQEAIIQVFRYKAQKCGTKLTLSEYVDTKDYTTDLKGSYQKKNVRTAVTALRVLKESGMDISEEHIREGLNKVVLNTGLLGRWQVLQEKPKVICDTGHNREGLEEVFTQLGKEQFTTLHMVIGVVNDKKLDDVLPMFPKEAVYYFCKPDIPRGLDAVELQKSAKEYNMIGDSYSSVSEAYDTALKNAKSGDLIYVGGSTFVVAEVL